MKPPRPDRLPSDTEEVAIRPDFDGQLAVRLECRGYNWNHRARAVTVHGDGRIEWHDDPTGLTPIAAAWHRELAKTARDLRSQVPCTLEGDYCIPHSWDAGIQKIRCPQQRLADILDALDDLERKP